MENGSFEDAFPIEHGEYSIAVLVYQRVVLLFEPMIILCFQSSSMILGFSKEIMHRKMYFLSREHSHSKGKNTADQEFYASKITYYIYIHTHTFV